MTILLDEGVPENLKLRLRGHLVESVRTLDWLGVKNGSLLKLIEQTGFEVFITADKNMTHQQPMTQLPFATLVLSTNSWPVLRNHIPVIRDAVTSVTAGGVLVVNCGTFIPGRVRDRPRAE